MTNETVAARPAALAAPAPRKARRPLPTLTSLLRRMTAGAAAMDPIDRLMAQASAEQTADYVRMSLLSRSIDGDAWATATLTALYAGR